jgi:hypothetical protein
MIFAYGSWVGNPDSVNANLTFHETEGVFTLDMTEASGHGGVPDVTVLNEGATEVSIRSTHDLASPAHGKFFRPNIFPRRAN